MSLFKNSDKFIIVTQDGSGCGFAKILADQGNDVILARKMKDEDEKDPDEVSKFELAGDGITKLDFLDDLFNERKKYRDWVWVWDGNHNSDKADRLRKEGFDVIGGHELASRMEDDRQFGADLVKKAGLETPPTFEFDDIESGIDHLEANEDKAYVFKPDEPDEEAWVTTLPSNERDDKANEEMVRVLRSFGEAKSPYILQERKKGVEVNVEFFVYKGQPYFAHANFECKRKYNRDLGRLIGCSQDIEFVIPIDCKILKNTLWKLVKLPEFKDYSGLLDMNLIVSDRGFYFLEFCARFGYNSHPNLFMKSAFAVLLIPLNCFLPTT